MRFVLSCERRCRASHASGCVCIGYIDMRLARPGDVMSMLNDRGAMLEIWRLDVSRGVTTKIIVTEKCLRGLASIDERRHGVMMPSDVRAHLLRRSEP